MPTKWVNCERRPHTPSTGIDRRRRRDNARNLLHPDFLFFPLKGQTMETINTTPAEITRAIATQLITAHTHKADEPTYTLRLSGRKATK